MPPVDIIKPRGGTAARWAEVNPILAVREEGFETDTGKTKYGDGATHWNDLPYATAGGGGGASIILTQEEYDAIPTPDPATLYIIEAPASGTGVVPVSASIEAATEVVLWERQLEGDAFPQLRQVVFIIDATTRLTTIYAGDGTEEPTNEIATYEMDAPGDVYTYLHGTLRHRGNSVGFLSASPVGRASHPTTLQDVIDILVSLGFADSA